MIKNLYMRILLLILICFLSVNCAYCYNLDFFSRFSDKFLDEYIQEALINNHDLKAANQKLEQYRFQIKEQFAKELPQASVMSNYAGAHFPVNDNNIFIKQNSYVLPLRASYEPDLLLKNRDKTKSKRKLFMAQCANKDSVYISLLSDVACAYINILLFDYLIEKELQILNSKIQSLSYNSKKYKSGIIDTVEFNSYLQELENEKIIYENLVKNQKNTLFNFASLIGRSSDNYQELERGKLEDFEYIETIPDIINSDLIYSRPDVIEIENKLRSSKIDITVAKKEFFPSFNITGFLVFDTAGAGNFFSWESSFAFLIAGLAQDIFKGGEKIANLKIKKAKYLELFEQYKQIELNAIKEINSTLNAIKQDTKSENTSKNQVIIEKRNLNATNKKLKRGIVSNIDYLDNKILLSQKEQLSATAKAQRLADYLSLYKAVGGKL